MAISEMRIVFTDAREPGALFIDGFEAGCVERLTVETKTSLGGGLLASDILGVAYPAADDDEPGPRASTITMTFGPPPPPSRWWKLNRSQRCVLSIGTAWMVGMFLAALGSEPWPIPLVNALCWASLTAVLIWRLGKRDVWRGLKGRAE